MRNLGENVTSPSFYTVSYLRRIFLPFFFFTFSTSTTLDFVLTFFLLLFFPSAFDKRLLTKITPVFITDLMTIPLKFIPYLYLPESNTYSGQERISRKLIMLERIKWEKKVILRFYILLWRKTMLLYVILNNKFSWPLRLGNATKDTRWWWKH